MDLNEFIANFAEQFDDTAPAEITADTVFKDLDDWSSMVALSLIAMIDAEYDVTINGNTIQDSATVKDLFDAVQKIKG